MSVDLLALSNFNSNSTQWFSTSWALGIFSDFFKRIQGGGTPMTVQELRRVLSQGPFTKLLDDLTTDDVVKKTFEGCSDLGSFS